MREGEPIESEPVPCRDCARASAATVDDESAAVAAAVAVSLSAVSAIDPAGLDVLAPSRRRKTLWTSLRRRLR